MGAFDGPTDTRIHVHVYTGEKGDYYDIADGAPQFDTVPPPRRAWTRRASRGEEVFRLATPKLVLTPFFIIWIVVGVRSIFGLASGDVAWAMFLLVTVVALFFTLPMFLRHDVNLADGMIGGPSKRIGPFLGWQRAIIRVDEITGVRSAPFKFSYYEGRAGQRVYVFTEHGNYRDFARTLEEHGGPAAS